MGVTNIDTTVFQQGSTLLVQSTGTSVQSAVLSDSFSTGGGAVKVLLVADGSLFFKVGSNPTATTASGGGSFLSDGSGVTIEVPADEKIATISKSGTTDLSITQLL